MEDLFGPDKARVQTRRSRMKSLMDEEGLPYGERKMTYNSRLAQELGKWAEGRPNGDRIHDLIFRAYFVDNINIAQPEILLKLVQRAGLPVDEAREVLASRMFKDEVDADWKRCRDIGVTGVPTFMIDHSVAVGAQPYEELERFIRQSIEA